MFYVRLRRTFKINKSFYIRVDVHGCTNVAKHTDVLERPFALICGLII